MLDEILRGRGALIELIAAAIGLALGVNILSGVATSTLGWPLHVQVICAISLIVAALWVVSRKIFAAANVRKELSGVVVHDEENFVVLEIPRYRLSESITRYLNSLFSENAAIKNLWDKDPISKTFDFSEPGKAPTYRTTAAGELMREALEYFVLDRLSTHLTDYFNAPNFDKSRLETFSRVDVPSVLFKNRFLETFSKPMSERPAFVETDGDNIGKYFGTVVSSFGGNNALYDRFELTLPYGSKISRHSNGGIEIVTPKFVLSIRPEFSGFNGGLPLSFEKLYMGRSETDKVRTYVVGVSIEINFKPFALLTKSGWEYHMWIDSFLSTLEDEFSVERFLSNISWEAAETVIRSIEGKLGNSTRKDQK